MSGPRPVSQQSATTAGSSASPSRPQRSRPGPAVGVGQTAPFHPAESGAVVAAPSPLLGEFIRALLAPEEERVTRFVERLLEAGATPQGVFEDLFTPAARLLGQFWETDDCSFYEVTVGTGRIQRMVRELSHRFLADRSFPGSSGRILLGCAPGEQHSLGLAILAEFFVRDGWDVHLTTGVGSDGLLDKVRESEYNCVGLSVSAIDKAAVLKREIQMIRQVSRNRDIRILVGGNIITTDPGEARRVGADGYALDAAGAVHEARRLMAQS